MSLVYGFILSWSGKTRFYDNMAGVDGGAIVVYDHTCVFGSGDTTFSRNGALDNAGDIWCSVIAPYRGALKGFWPSQQAQCSILPLIELLVIQNGTHRHRIHNYSYPLGVFLRRSFHGAYQEVFQAENRFAGFMEKCAMSRAFLRESFATCTYILFCIGRKSRFKQNLNASKLLNIHPNTVEKM